MKKGPYTKSQVSPSGKPAYNIRPEWVFTGGISNITGGFDMFELGSMRRISRQVPRDKFVENYVHDISSLFDLNEGQQSLLKMFLTDPQFKTPFRYDEDSNVKWAEKTKLTATTVRGYFRSLVSAKKLIRMVRRGQYRLNNEFIFHSHEIRNADFLSLHLTYSFTKEEGAETVIVDKPNRVTMEMINRLIEIKNEQDADEKRAHDLFSSKENEVKKESDVKETD